MHTDITNGVTITDFNENNKATDASNNTHIKHYFTDYTIVKRILKHLPNKISNGVDNIPSIIIKHLSKFNPKNYRRSFQLIALFKNECFFSCAGFLRIYVYSAFSLQNYVS